MKLRPGLILKYLRVALSLLLLVMLSWALFAVPGVIVGVSLGWIGDLQLIPMTLIGGSLAACVWIAVTLLLGRVYCSTVCPLGTVMDIVAHISRRVSGLPYRYTPPRPWYLRCAMIALLAATACMGTIASTWTLMPFIQVSPTDSYTLIITTLLHAGSIPLRVAVATLINLVFIITLAAMRGRELCNTLCPLGAGLGAINTISLLHVDIDTDRCTHCRRCEDACKATCLDSDAGIIDLSRCVNCFNCLAVCPDEAISYRTGRHRLSTPLMTPVKSPQTTLTDNTTPNETIS